MNVILKKEAIEYFNEKLSLPYNGVEQDWELEMADSDRLIEFVSCYESSDLSVDRKRALMSLIMASYDDFIDKNNLTIDESWDKIKSMLELEKDIFSELIDYWSLYDESNPENFFKITPLIREIRNL